MKTSDQLLDMLKTIGEAAAFLRKRCAAGQAGQSMALFEDLASLLDLLDNRFRKSGYLPRDRAPVFGNNPDILSAVRFLDAVDAWSEKTRENVRRRKVRQELARGGLLEAAAKGGKPFAREAAEMAQFVRSGTPEERAEMDKGVSVSFSSESVEKARAARETEAGEAAPAPAPDREQAEKPGLSDPASEGARLFAAVRARTGRSVPMEGRPTGMEGEEDPEAPFPMNAGTQEPESGARPMRGRRGEAEDGARPMGAKPMEPEGRARPMRGRREEAEEGARPMGAKPMEPEGGARPMRGRREEAEEGARPMGAKPMEPEGGARPMRGRGEEAEEGARPMGAKPMEPEGGARPMRARQAERENAARPSRRAPERPAAMETTTTPAVGRGITIDREFLRIMNELGSIQEEDLEKKLCDAFPRLENRYKIVICDQMRRFGYWGRLEPDRNEFEALRRRAQELSRHRDEYSWLYGRLGDYRSRKTLLAILDNWYAFNFKDLSNMKDKLFAPYLDADLLRCTDEEVFVDLGAGMGDVTAAFAEFAGHWKKIYCYEPQPGNFSALRGRVRDLGLVEARQKAVSDKAGEGALLVRDDPLLARLSDEGGIKVGTVQLDEDIQEPVSIIKMCLEGGEQAAIRGCSNHIHRDHPRLVMRADHGDSDLWQLPRMIERLDKKYRFFLRHYGGNLLPTEYILYAI